MAKSRRQQEGKMTKFSFNSDQDQICECIRPNRDQDCQRPILMDQRYRSGPIDQTSVSLCGTLLVDRRSCFDSNL